MKTNFYIAPSLYESVLDILNETHFVETKGNLSDFIFLHDDIWLSDTAVIENVSLIYGLWEIELVFVLHTNYLKFIKRKIVSSYCRNKALLTASLMRRLAAKDQRGTLVVDTNRIEWCNN